MPTVKLTCEYCGTIWTEYVYGADAIPFCPKCNVVNDVKILEVEPKTEDRNPFGYDK